MTRHFYEYLTGTFGLPDVYIDAFPEYDYALMARQPAIASRYDPPIGIGIYQVYVKRDSPVRAALSERMRQVSEAVARMPHS